MHDQRPAATTPVLPEDCPAGEDVKAFAFGEFRLDLAREQLIGPRGGQILRRKTFATLRVLLHAAPAVVSLDQLLDGVWGRHAISTSAVPNVMVELRHALCDSAQSPRYIETRHRRGYRIIPLVRREVSATLPPARVEMHPLLRLLEDVRRTSVHASPRRQLELLQGAASERGLTFLALQAQLALQAHGGAFVETVLAAPEEAAVSDLL